MSSAYIFWASDIIIMKVVIILNFSLRNSLLPRVASLQAETCDYALRIRPYIFPSPLLFVSFSFWGHRGVCLVAIVSSFLGNESRDNFFLLMKRTLHQRENKWLNNFFFLLYSVRFSSSYSLLHTAKLKFFSAFYIDSLKTQFMNTNSQFCQLIIR